MSKIPTAEEFLNRGLYDSGFELSGAQLKIIARNAREFAKLHVEAALKVASELSNLDLANDSAPDKLISLPDDILNSYPLTLIK